MTKQRIYLQQIQERIERIELYIADGEKTFYASTLLQDAIIRNFEVIGEITKRLAPELTMLQATIPWQQIAGFRDVLIHHYQEVDLDFVWQTCVNDLAPLKKAILALINHLEIDS